MIRILHPEAGVPNSSGKASPSEEALRGGEIEYVVGRRQMASLGFLAVVILAVVSGVSYMVGRAAGTQGAAARAASAPPPLVISSAVPAGKAEAAAPVSIDAPGSPAQTGIVQASSKAVAPPVAVKPAADTLDPALVGQIAPGSRYLQVGAVDKNAAVSMTQSLRDKALHGFIASGPVNGVYRVLVGPLPDDDEFNAAKATVESMGITTFVRQ